MSLEPAPDPSSFADFADAIAGHRVRTERVVRDALGRVSARAVDASSDLADMSIALDGTFRTLDTAAEELRVQNEALFAARIELEDASALFRDLFELAPTAYLVTTNETRIVYANEAACGLLRIAKNALSGKPFTCFIPLEERAAFRAGVMRACEANGVSTWPTTLGPRGVPSRIECRLRVRSVSASGGRMPRMLYWNITEETDEDLF